MRNGVGWPSCFGVVIPRGPNCRAKGIGCAERVRPRVDRGRTVSKNRRGLFTQAQLLEHALVAVVRSALEVVEHLASPGDHLEEAAARGMILDVRLQMIGELIDAVGQQSHLHVRAPRVFLVHPERMNILSVCHIVIS